MNEAMSMGTKVDVKEAAAAAVAADPELRRFLARLLAFEESYVRQFLAHGERLESLVDPGQAMATDAFVTLAGAKAGHVAATRYRAWLDEREQLLDAYLAEFNQTLAAVPRSPVHDDFVVATSGESPEESLAISQRMTAAECAQADAFIAIYAWCVQESGRFGEVSGQLAFMNHDQQRAWIALREAIRVAESRVEEARAAFVPAQTRFQASTYDWLARARTMLGLPPRT